MSDRCDVAVVGAGLAGLTLARHLDTIGATVRVIEARDRVGGRTLTRELAGAPFDLGGQWIGPRQSRVAGLCRELGVKTFPQFNTGDKVLDRDGTISHYRGNIPSLGVVGLLEVELGLRRLDAMARRVPLDAPALAHRASEWDSLTVACFAKRQLRHPAARAAFDTAVRVVFGAESSELSLLYFLFYLNAGGGLRRLVEVTGGAQERRLVGGAQQLSERLAQGLGERVELSAPVRRIEQREEEVILHTDRGVFAARQAVIAIPPQLAARIQYEPALPALRDQLVQRWSMGATIKIVAAYETPRWRASGLSGEAVSTKGPLSCTFDATSPDGSVPALVAFVVGKEARRFGALSPDERRALALAELARLVGAPATEVVGYLEQDWASEPFTGGCPAATLASGALTGVSDGWRAPVGRLHWAGTETARNWNGYLEGALESAERVASEVLAALGRR
jgi:monoamine oxidase